MCAQFFRDLVARGSPAAEPLLVVLDGLDETLTLHRLVVFPELGTSFKTTKLLESVMAQIEAKTARVDCWRTSGAEAAVVCRRAAGH